MTIQHIKYFILTAECLSFSKAAELLYVTQPVLSRAVTAMEKEWNVLLFNRYSNHTVDLTPAGRLLLIELKKIYGAYVEAVEKAQKLAYSIDRHFRIGVIQNVTVGDFMPEILGQIFQKYPNVDVDLRYFGFNQLSRMLCNRELDLILTLYFTIDQLDNVSFQVISKSVDYLAMNRSHPLAARKRVTLEDVKDERFIMLSREDCDNSADLIIAELQKYNFCPDIIYARDYQTLSLWVEAGYGIAVVDSRNIIRRLPNIVSHPFTGSWDPSLTAAWLPDNPNSMIEVFLREIKAIHMEI